MKEPLSFSFTNFRLRVSRRFNFRSYASMSDNFASDNLVISGLDNSIVYIEKPFFSFKFPS